MKLKINYKYFMLIFAVILFFKPLAINSLEKYSTLDKIWDICRVCTCVIILYKTVFRRKKIAKVPMYIIVLEGFFCFSTIIKGGDVQGFIVQSVSIIAFCLLISNEIKENLLMVCKAMFYSLSTLILIHLIFLIIYPNGLGYDTVYYNEIYFLASKNGLIKFMLPAIVSGLLFSEISKGKILKRVWIIIIICLCICIISESMTSVIGILVCLIINFLPNLNKIKNMRLDFQKIFLLVFTLSIVGTLIEVNGGFVNILKLFVQGDKLSNYTARITIWQEAIKKILLSPIIGYGMPKNGGHIIINGKPMYAHNGYLEILLYGGIIGFALFVVILKKFLFVKSRYLNKEIICVASGIVAFLIMMLTETHINTISFWAFLTMYEYIVNRNIGNIVNKKKSKEEL